MKNKTIWAVNYRHGGIEYKALRYFSAGGRYKTGKSAAKAYMLELLKTPKYKSKEEDLWVDKAGNDRCEMWVV